MLNEEMLEKLRVSVAKRQIHTTDWVGVQGEFVWIGGRDGNGNVADTAKFSLDFSIVWVDRMFLDGYSSNFYDGVVSRILEEIGFDGEIITI